MTDHSHNPDRRFLLQGALFGGLGAAQGILPFRLFGRNRRKTTTQSPAPTAPWFRISLAQWSLHRAFFAKKLDPMEFPVIAKRDYGIEGVEFVNQFFKGQAEDTKVIEGLRRRCADHGVTAVLIMCDGEGFLGDADKAKRAQAVRNHHKWVNAAVALGCHSIRVNAYSTGTYDEQMGRAAEGLAALTEYGASKKINIIVENHGGLSSNGEWLAGVMKKVNNPRCGTLPDFGNFRLSEGKEYDRYKGVLEMMPFAKGVSAKSHDFDAKGAETRTDYKRMLEIVKGAGYRGWIGIEYEGGKLAEPEGIVATRKLLERVRAEMPGA